MLLRIYSMILILLSVVKIGFSGSPTMAEPLEEKPLTTNAAVQECGESAPGIFWPVFLTLVVVFAVMAVVYFFWKYYWRIFHGKHLVLVTDAEKGEPEFAFDNPGFREGTPVIQAKKLAAEAKEKAIEKESNNLQKISNGHKPQSLDDSELQTKSPDQKTNVIALKSRDFTGLGFNICGNMRDGIFVKDLLHHGPAWESGRIKTGDRISAVRINFSHMVYEDAMAILGYASPYEVEVEVEDSSMSPISLKNSSMNNHIAHSFFRSQSFSTAQQIQKIIPRKLNFNSSPTKIEPGLFSKPAVLEVSEISDKMSKYGVKVLPDIKSQSTVVNVTVPLVNSEKQQNTTVIEIQSDSGIDTKTPSSNFDEVDLCSTATHQHNEKSTLASTFRDNNMKKVLVKGIQNLKEKLNNHIQRSNEKFTKETLDVTKEDKTDGNDGLKSNEEIDLRLRSNSESSDEMDDSLKKASKRKAPPPPVILSSITKEQSEFNLLNEIENEVNKNNYDKESDSETETDITSNTIELNSTHITVHHVPEESNRKAASLGDLSKIAENDLSLTSPLERAVSLELTEHTPRGSKKRKAPMPPEDSNTDESLLFGKELKLENGHSSKLKKSSLFGTLEEAVKQNDDILPSNNENLLTTSTPMKMPDEDNKFLSMDSCSNISWELNFDLQDDAKDNLFMDSDEKVPDLPTTPMPHLPTFVTEIKVSNDDDTTKVNSNDLTLFMTAAEVNSNIANESSQLSTEESEPTIEIKDQGIILNKEENISEIKDSKDDLVIDLGQKIDSRDYICEIASSSSDERSANVMFISNQCKSTKFTKNVSNEQTSTSSSSNQFGQIENQSIQSNQELNLLTQISQPLQSSQSAFSAQVAPRHRLNNGDVTVSKLKSPNTPTKLPKLSQSLSPVRVIGSRIPVRANTEPSLKVSLINKEDYVSKTRKYKLSEDSLENGKVTFSSSNHLPSAAHKTSVLSETRHIGPNR